MLRQRLALKGDDMWAEVPQGTQERLRQWLTRAVRGRLTQQGLATDLRPAQQPSDTWHGYARASAQAWMATTASATNSAVTELLEWLAQQEQQRSEVTRHRLARKAAELLVVMLQQPAEEGQRLWGRSEKAPKSLIETWAVQVAYLLASQISLMAVAVQHPHLLRWVPDSPLFTYVQPDLVGKAEWVNPYAYLPDTTLRVKRAHRSNGEGAGGWRNQLLGRARVSPGGPSQYLGIADRVQRGGGYAPPRAYSSDAIMPCPSKFLLPGVLWSSTEFFQMVDTEPSHAEGASAGAGNSGSGSGARQPAAAREASAAVPASTPPPPPRRQLQLQPPPPPAPAATAAAPLALQGGLPLPLPPVASQHVPRWIRSVVVSPITTGTTASQGAGLTGGGAELEGKSMGQPARPPLAAGSDGDVSAAAGSRSVSRSVPVAAQPQSDTGPVRSGQATANGAGPAPRGRSRSRNRGRHASSRSRSHQRSRHGKGKDRSRSRSADSESRSHGRHSRRRPGKERDTRKGGN
jgi:hypothetical protein